jgi:adenylate cyclase
MAMQPKLAAILALEAASRPEPDAGETTAGRELGAIQCELVDPTISRYGGRIFALTPSRTLVEFAEAATAVRCAVEIQRGMAERNGELPAERRVELRIGVDMGEVASVSGDLAGAPVVIARGLARSAAAGAVAVSGAVARRIERRRPGTAIARRGQLALAGGGKLEVVELRPVAAPKAQSPWILRRRWTWIAALAAVVLLLGASVVLWRPIREWLLPLPATTASDGPAPAAAVPR